jgi:hypothetical protein
MADLTAALARLEQLARAVPAESIGPAAWWTVETLMRSMNQDHICDEDAEFIEACDPGTVLMLVRVARAAQEIQRLRALPLRMPEGGNLVARVRHAEYAEEKQAAWDALRAALEELNTAARLSGPAQGLEVTGG